MKLRNLFIVNIFIAIFFGGSCTFFPHFVYSLYNVVPDEAAIWAARLTGGSILGFATLMWFGIKAASSESRRAIAIALLVQDTVGFVASIIFQLKEEVNAFGWVSLALYGVLALAYAYFIFIRPGKD
jgi:hypothetical protein